ncbi:N(2)-fixation sustaining protein CowN [Zoogloea dura]|uniref:N(2)-fixation sustaining protein CowN n=1 Tax=Zoogloea dura TaxID=2728840 RepID=A0A848GBF1_9RHOO|nr:N(2)-fixation sustaining protein CowN [Zoogloea dura]NML28889.1 N(2)-fixation sustaining protein CowN [Zoogloea dura]
MSCTCRKSADPLLGDPDRYVSFIGLDCDARAAHLMQRVRHYIDDPRHSNAFWEYFKKKAAGANGPRLDDLLLIHCHLGQIRELFEDLDDAEGLALVDGIEKECC